MRYDNEATRYRLAAALLAAFAFGCGSERPGFGDGSASEEFASGGAGGFSQTGAGGKGGASSTASTSPSAVTASPPGATASARPGTTLGAEAPHVAVSTMPGTPSTSGGADAAGVGGAPVNAAAPSPITPETSDPGTNEPASTAPLPSPSADTATEPGPQPSAPDTPAAPELLSTGESCGDNADCTSGYCVDGVCCETSCAEDCAQCDAAGTEGTCTQSSEGECAAATCVSPMKLCDGQCVAASECCGCGGDTPVCDNGTCVARSQGDTCERDSECSTGQCEDGRCCDVACDGQCESCAVAGSLGTCLPVNTPRTPCGGTGACAGSCDGTAQNRKSCVFPSAATTCGDAAQCDDDTLTTAAVCDGAGQCVEGSEMSCTYGCRPDGQAACATTCPSDQDLCDGTCVETESNPDACGSSCTECSGSKPLCEDGKCVQCTEPSDCTSIHSSMTCTADNTCRCGPGTHACGASTAPCFSDSDVSACGTSCIDCRQPNANQACGSDGQCANTCSNPLTTLTECPKVQGKPSCVHWAFESGTTEGWELHNGGGLASNGPLRVVQKGGSYALEIPFSNVFPNGSGFDASRYVEIRVKVCLGSGANVVDLSDGNFRWRFHMEGDLQSDDLGYNSLIYFPAAGFADGVYMHAFNADVDADFDQEQRLLGDSFGQIYGIGFKFATNRQFEGNMYLDDIRAELPQ